MINPTPRLRIFAGPNGSGKSTIIDAVKSEKAKGRPINLGFYINADDIAVQVKTTGFSTTDFKFEYDDAAFKIFAAGSGLLNDVFDMHALSTSMFLKDDKVYASNTADENQVQKLTQIIARYLREKMLEKKVTFSFETVFSHDSNIDLMKAAVAQGYKVYLYMVATEEPAINIFRVEARVKQNGHDVPHHTITKRYFRSLNYMFGAAQVCYQAYFFDNSVDGSPFKKIAHFKLVNGKKIWEDLGILIYDLPEWFKKYYLEKVDS